METSESTSIIKKAKGIFGHWAINKTEVTFTLTSSG